MEDTAWESDSDSHVVSVDNHQAAPGTVQAVRQQDVYHEDAARYGTHEEDTRGNAAQVGADGSADVLSGIGEDRQHVRLGRRQNDDLEIGATGWRRDGFCSGRE